MPQNILVIGASQGCGALAVQEALARGHRVTAFSRNPQKLGIEHPNLRYLPGDFHDAASVNAAVPGHDAVIITASASGPAAFKENPRYFSQGTALVIDAMKAHGVRRLVVLSAIGTGNSRHLLPLPVRLLVVHWLVKLPYADHEVQEPMAANSGLDWVIVRPGRLTNGPATHAYVKTKELRKVPSSIARANVAQFLVEACESPEWVNSYVQLGG